MFLSTLASLKTRLRALRPSKKQKRKSTVPPSSDIPTEKAPTVAPTLVVSLPPPMDVRPEVRYERKMGDSELSYYLPSRANGVNDMCVFSATCRWPLELIASAQVSSSRFQSTKPHHDAREGARRLGDPPPKASVARGEGGDARLRRRPICVRTEISIENVELTLRLRYQPDASAQDAVKSADANLEYRTQTKDRESILFCI